MGRWEEGVGGRGGSTLELDLYDHFLAGASAGGCNTDLDEGRVGVDLGEGEERQVGSGRVHQYNQLCGAEYPHASLLSRR
jgi:hypothetical protein